VTVLDADRSYGPATAEQRAWAREWRARELLAGAEIVRAALEDGARLRREVRARRPEVVVHLANLPLPAVARRRPSEAVRSIAGSMRTVLDALTGAPGLQRLTYVSSSMVYGDFAREPMPEHGPLRPRDHYGRLKLRAEGMARAWAQAGGPLTVVRPSAVYGPGEINGRFAQRLVEAALGGVPLLLDAAPGTRLDFTWVGDLAWGIAEASLAPAGRGETFNLSRGEARTLEEAVARAGDVPVVRAGAGTWRPAPRRGALDISRAARLLGYAPRVGLEDGLEAYAGAAAWPAAA
jgi:nucleoside-diphosphate-sugar epimerase